VVGLSLHSIYTTHSEPADLQVGVAVLMGEGERTDVTFTLGTNRYNNGTA